MKISIIIPVYNTEAYLPKCLDSVINQTYKDIEIIIVDDCSLGNCREIVKEYQERNEKIIYVKQEENKGTFFARQIGTFKATGDYILYLDSDDYLGIDLCQQIVQAGKDFPELLIYDTISVLPKKEEKAIWTNQGAQNFDNGDLFSSFCERKFSSWATCGKVLRRNLALEVYQKIDLSHRLIIAEDLLYFFCYSYFCNRVIYVPYVGYYYNLTNISVNRVEYTLEKAKVHLENLSLVLEKMKFFCYDCNIDLVLIDTLVEELFQSYIIRFSELNIQEQQIILSQLISTFGGEVIVQYLSDQAVFRDDKIRILSDRISRKIFPKTSCQYALLRSLLINIYHFIKRWI